MRRLVLTAAATFLVDQATKLSVIHLLHLPVLGDMKVIDPLLNFRWAENRGVNFGLFAQHQDLGRWVLILLALAICAWVVVWVHREGGKPWPQVAAGLLVGGALGNVVDRVAYGYVADFLNMSCCGIENPFSFNVADVAIFLGAVGLILLPGKAPPRPALGGAKTP
jgi:signal peptidase II